MRLLSFKREAWQSGTGGQELCQFKKIKTAILSLS